MSGNGKAHELVLLDQASHALAEARTLDEIKVIRDKAEAVRKYAQSASLGLDVQNRAAEVKLRAERQAGKLLSQLMLRGGDRRSKSHHDRLKLQDLGLTANQSKRWQLQARVPEGLFREHVRHMRLQGKELTSAGLMRLAKRMKAESAEANGGPPRSRISIRPDVHGNGHGNRNRRHGLDDYSPKDALAELVDELRNHHHVLDGILQPLYAGESQELRPAELRMMRYLMSEMGTLLGQIGSIERVSAAGACHRERAAV